MPRDRREQPSDPQDERLSRGKRLAGQRRPLRPAEPAPSSEERGDLPPSFPSITPSGPRIRPSRGAARNSSGGAKAATELAKIVVGGAGGVSLATVILLYVFGIDPFGLLPTPPPRAPNDPSTLAIQQAERSLMEFVGLSHISKDTKVFPGAKPTDWIISGHARGDSEHVHEFTCQYSVTQWNDARRWALKSIFIDGEQKWPAPPRPRKPDGASKPEDPEPRHHKAPERKRDDDPQPVPVVQSKHAEPRPKAEEAPPLCENTVFVKFDDPQEVLPLAPDDAELNAQPDELIMEVSDLASFPAAARFLTPNRASLDQACEIALTEQADARIRVELIRHQDGVAARVAPVLKGADSAEKPFTRSQLLLLKRSAEHQLQEARKSCELIRQHLLAADANRSELMKTLVPPERLNEKQARVRWFEQQMAAGQQRWEEQLKLVQEVEQRCERIAGLASLAKSYGNSANFTVRLLRM
jgi:hypothetical protein